MAEVQAEGMSGLYWGRLHADVAGQWAALTNELARVDETGEFYDAADLAEELTECGMTPEHDTWAVWDGDKLVAYGQLRVGFTASSDGTFRCDLAGGVLPEWRGRGIGRRMMDEMEWRAGEVNAWRNAGAPGTFRASGGRIGSSASAMLEARGYQIARYFTLMERPLPGDALPGQPNGLPSPTPGDSEDVRVAHNAAFADHWGSAPMTPERWHDFYAGRPARPQFSTIARDESGVTSYALVSQYLPDELFIDLVGTVPRARGRGLAEAVLSRSITLAGRVQGVRVLGLEVDSESPTGADRLYERLGFVPKHTTSAMTRPA